VVEVRAQVISRGVHVPDRSNLDLRNSPNNLDLLVNNNFLKKPKINSKQTRSVGQNQETKNLDKVCKKAKVVQMF
jgi:hypothetical protein